MSNQEGRNCENCEYKHITSIGWCYMFREKREVCSQFKPKQPPEDNVTKGLSLEYKIRYYLWLNHGHTQLYGDDGQMQCSECRFTDYKHDNFEKIVDQALKVKEELAIKSMQPKDKTTCIDCVTVKEAVARERKRIKTKAYELWRYREDDKVVLLNDLILAIEEQSEGKEKTK